jgi:GTP cyclohydrolase II
LVSVHRECRTGDVFRSHACSCRERLDGALGAIAAAPRGVLLYLTSPEELHLGTGAPRRHRPLSAAERDACDQMLIDLGPTSLSLLTGDARSRQAC